MACAVARRALDDGQAGRTHLADDLDGTIRRAMWFPDYVPIRHEP